MKKSYILGFISGAVIFGTAGALATGLLATDNPFPVQLNGSQVSIEGYNIEGSTYFKLRDIADVVGGFDVGFNDNTIQLSKDGYVYAVGNKYNNQGYVDISGRTIAQVAEEAGITLEQFLSDYGLPADMPGDTTESAAYNNIPVGIMAGMYETDFYGLKELLVFPDDVTEATPWGEALDKVTLRVYIGEENFAEFKEYYGLDDSVTLDTLWGEIRNIVEEQQRAERIAEEGGSY